MEKIRFAGGFFKITLIVSLLLTYSSRIFSQSKPWPVPSSALSMKNPLPKDANTIKTGKTLYTTYCSPCHGNTGKGDGAAAAALDPKPANHTSDAIQAEPDGSLFYKISEGRKPMPQYKSAFSEEQRWALANYIKTLGKKR